MSTNLIISKIVHIYHIFMPSLSLLCKHHPFVRSPYATMLETASSRKKVLDTNTNTKRLDKRLAMRGNSIVILKQCCWGN